MSALFPFSDDTSLKYRNLYPREYFQRAFRKYFAIRRIEVNDNNYPGNNCKCNKYVSHPAVSSEKSKSIRLSKRRIKQVAGISFAVDSMLFMHTGGLYHG